MPHTPRPDNSTGNDGHNKPRRNLPYIIWSNKMQASVNWARPRKQDHPKQHSPERSTQIQTPRKNIHYERQPWGTPERPRIQNNGGPPENTSRDRRHRILSDENESDLAIHRGNRHPNPSIRIRSTGPNKKGRGSDTKDIQYDTENIEEPTPGNLHIYWPVSQIRAPPGGLSRISGKLWQDYSNCYMFWT